MKVIYEDNHFEIRKLLILRDNTDNQRLADFVKNRQLAENHCRTIVEEAVTNRFVVGKNMVIYETESDYPTSQGAH